MESNAIKEDINTDTPEEATMDVSFGEIAGNNKLIIDDNSTVVPVIIEELDENAINTMDVDMSEFVEAKALQIQEVKNVIIPRYTLSTSCSSSKDVAMDTDQEQDVLLTTDEEDRLTRQFLNGELTFCEYSSKMDQDVESETLENDAPRYDRAEKKISLNSCRISLRIAKHLWSLFAKVTPDEFLSPGHMIPGKQALTSK